MNIDIADPPPAIKIAVSIGAIAILILVLVGASAIAPDDMIRSTLDRMEGLSEMYLHDFPEDAIR